MSATELFGERVRELRHANKLSQEQLAERARVHRSYIASIETGDRNVGLKNIVQIAHALGVHPAELFRGFPPNRVGADDSPQEHR